MAFLVGGPLFLTCLRMSSTIVFLSDELSFSTLSRCVRVCWCLYTQNMCCVWGFPRCCVPRFLSSLGGLLDDFPFVFIPGISLGAKCSSLWREWGFFFHASWWWAYVVWVCVSCACVGCLCVLSCAETFIFHPSF